MQLKPGQRLASQVCSAEVVVVKAPADDVDLRCGGHPLLPAGESPDGGLALDPQQSSGTALGKRYGSVELGLQVLCTKPGEGTLAIGDQTLERVDTTALPSSD